MIPGPVLFAWIQGADFYRDLHRQAVELLPLWSGVRPAGALLMVEPSERLNPDNAKRILEKPLPPKRLKGLMMWATARQGRAVPAKIYDAVPARSAERTELLHGLVDAWVLRKAGE